MECSKRNTTSRLYLSEATSEATSDATLQRDDRPSGGIMEPSFGGMVRSHPFGAAKGLLESGEAETIPGMKNDQL